MPFIHQTLSLYIPRVYNKISEKEIADTFEPFGKVRIVEFQGKIDRNMTEYNSVYVRFTKWYNTEMTERFQSKVLNARKVVRIRRHNWVILPNFDAVNKRQPTLLLYEDPEPESYPLIPATASTTATATAAVESGAIMEANEVNEDAAILLTDEDYEHMDQLELLMQEEDSDLIMIDRRYVSMIEGRVSELEKVIKKQRRRLIELEEDLELAQLMGFQIPPANIPVNEPFIVATAAK